MEMRKCAPVLLGEVGVTISRHTIPSLAFTMRRAYGVLACNCQAERDSQIPVLKRLWFGTFSARQIL